MPIAMMVSSKALVRLVADPAGRLRMITKTGELGPQITVSEAARIARGA
ncbi:hypothetical protein [Neoroseomonas rubea]|nr:hypothetical protein [Roseomonas rubea]